MVGCLTGAPEADLRQAAGWVGTSRTTFSTCPQGVHQDEVLAGIPPDLRAQFEVHAYLSGLTPEVPTPAAERRTAKLVESHDDAKRPIERGGGRRSW